MTTIAPPQAEQSERAVLSYLINHGLQLDQVMGLTCSNAFYTPNNRLIYECIENVIENGDEVTLINVSIQAKEISSALFYEVSQISINHTPLEDDIINLVKDVNSAYAKRETLKLSTLLAGAVSKNDSTIIAQYIEEYQETIANIGCVNDLGISQSEVLNETMKLIEDAKETRDKGKPLGILSGIKALDDAIGAFYPETQSIIAARPGGGKTTLALQIALNASDENVVDFYSFEMNPSKILRNGIAGVVKDSGIERSWIRDGKLTDDELIKIKELAIKALEKKNIRWNKGGGLTFQTLVRSIRNNHKRFGTNCVIIDYLQLIPIISKLPREQQVAHMSRTLKQLTIELKIPIIILAQLNREATKEKPKASHMRESDSVEMDADNVIICARPDGDGEYSFEVPEDEKVIDGICFIIGKARDGQVGDVFARHDGQMTRVFDPEEETVIEAFADISKKHALEHEKNVVEPIAEIESNLNFDNENNNEIPF